MGDNNTILEKLYEDQQGIRREVTEVKESVHNLDKKLELNTQNIYNQLEELKKQSASQHETLKEHSQRSDELKRQNELTEKWVKEEIDSLKTPRRFLKSTKNILIALGGVGGAIYGIYKVTLLFQS